MNTHLRVGFSPCPNDTFMFHALVHGQVPCPGLQLEFVIADVEELNRMAFEKKLDITKISYFALGHLLSDYLLLRSGSALGKNCGPMLIAKNPVDAKPEKINAMRIAIPGAYTTANFLMSIAFPEAKNKIPMLFSEIEQAVLNEDVDAGVIIHENRFTYQQKGLHKIADLGEYWEKTTGALIPLGGIAASRKLQPEIIQQFEAALKRSIEYAFDNPTAATGYIRNHAQEMEEEVMYNHIRLYVNEYSKDLGKEGQHAVERLFSMAMQKGLIPAYSGSIFVS